MDLYLATDLTPADGDEPAEFEEALVIVRLDEVPALLAAGEPLNAQDDRGVTAGREQAVGGRQGGREAGRRGGGRRQWPTAHHQLPRFPASPSSCLLPTGDSRRRSA